MIKYISAIFVALLASYSFSVEIPKDVRIKNRPPGICTWASLETIGRLHGIKSLYNLAEAQYKAGVYPGDEDSIARQLNALGVKFKMQSRGNDDREILKKYATKQGCMIGMHKMHVLVLSHYDDKKVEFYDTNYKDVVWEATRAWFDQNFDGFVVVIEP